MHASLEDRLTKALDELAAIKAQLAALEAALCQCQPQRAHSDYDRPALYLHAVGCPVANSQQAATR